MQRYCNWAGSVILAAAGGIWFPVAALANDPLASNNGLLPGRTEYEGPLKTANFDSPEIADPAVPVWTQGEPLTVANAPAYAARLKEFLDAPLRQLIDDAPNWDPVAAHFYDLVWLGEGETGPDGKTDPTSGREAVMNTYSGQILPPQTFHKDNRPAVPVQNHAVIYYNEQAAVGLGQVWSDLYNPNIRNFAFPEGSIVIKAEAATPTPEQWPVLTGASTWTVYRPPVNADSTDGGAEILTIHPVQISLRIKDSKASPVTGWVFASYVYDRSLGDDTTPAFDKFVPLGLQWGDDPEYANLPEGKPEGGSLTETWVNEKAPDYANDTMGWGGRLAGAMDVAVRHNVLTVSGERYPAEVPFAASSCQSCHSSAEYPFTSNLYPSPNKSFPPDGQTFLLYDPGSPDWQRWFQNDPGNRPLTHNRGVTALDYDMALMFSLSAFSAASGNRLLVVPDFDVH